MLGRIEGLSQRLYPLDSVLFKRRQQALMDQLDALQNPIFVAAGKRGVFDGALQVVYRRKQVFR